jgi:hypothetical protein
MRQISSQDLSDSQAAAGFLMVFSDNETPPVRKNMNCFWSISLRALQQNTTTTSSIQLNLTLQRLGKPTSTGHNHDKFSSTQCDIAALQGKTMLCAPFLFLFFSYKEKSVPRVAIDTVPSMSVWLPAALSIIALLSIHTVVWIGF